MLTQIELKRIWDYDADTGLFTRLVATSSKTKIGDVANCHNSGGYIQIRIGKRYLAQRLAWLYMTGNFPNNEINHQNNIKDDNRWMNLRDVTASVNCQNIRKPRENNKFGYLGVDWHKAIGKWRATITIDYKNIHLGYFTDKHEAAACYLQKKRELHPGNTL